MKRSVWLRDWASWCMPRVWMETRSIYFFISCHLVPFRIHPSHKSCAYAHDVYVESIFCSRIIIFFNSLQVIVYCAWSGHCYTFKYTALGQAIAIHLIRSTHSLTIASFTFVLWLFSHQVIYYFKWILMEMINDKL